MIVTVNGKQLEGSVQTRTNDSMWDGRESKAITTVMTYAEAVSLFVDDVPWAVTTDVTDENGAVRQITTDMSDYAISGAITDNRDGTVTVKMGKYRDAELMQIPIADVPKTHAAAVTMRRVIETIAQSIADDEDALMAAPLYPTWEGLIGVMVESGFRMRHDGGLYRVLQPHIIGAQWVPGAGTESLYVRIDETHAGTADDPIPYCGNMALSVGWYYTQDERLYLCVRDTVNPVHNALDELVGLYVQAVS